MERSALSFGDSKVKPEVRTFGELSGVLLQPESVKGMEEDSAYFMYRDLGKTKTDKEKIKKATLRYDITVIPPKNIGIEYVKTLGHFHPNAPNSDVSYPELYQVLSGRAHYLLQKMADDAVDDAVVVEARDGDIVLIPPGYGHVTINPKAVELKMANWVYRDFTSKYDTLNDKQGFAYYETVEDEWILNEDYTQPAALRRRRPIEPSLFGLSDSEDMYALVNSLDKLEFLTNPQKHFGMFVGLP